MSIDKGRFLSVNSRTARLLELLSLQSLQRLAKLEFNPSSLVRDGFPFDTLRGDMALNGGVLKTEGYRVTGPVADIALSGNTNIISERWDLKAVVCPIWMPAAPPWRRRWSIPWLALALLSPNGCSKSRSSEP